MATNQPLNNKKILITCGPTWVPVDDMRVISNQSSGALGQMLALKLLRQKANVTLLEGPVKMPLQDKGIKIFKYTTFNEFDRLLKGTLQKGFDCVIHAAAVSDYKLKKASKSKISSEHKELTLTLIPTKKIINTIKRISPKAFLVGFKLESNVNPTVARQKALQLCIKAKCDLVLVNSAKKMMYKGYLVDRIGNLLAKGSSREEISDQLIQTLRKKL